MTALKMLNRNKGSRSERRDRYDQPKAAGGPTATTQTPSTLRVAAPSELINGVGVRA
jgi:hypothetical protein